MHQHSVYEAYCRQCGDISLLQADNKDIHIQAAKSHHKSTGHTCEVYQETKSVVLYGKIPQVVSHHDSHVIATFGTR